MTAVSYTRPPSVPVIPVDDRKCSAAAKAGNVEELKRLRGEGEGWSEETCQAAAFGGSVEVLRWLREGGCPWNASTFAGCAAGAARNDRRKVGRRDTDLWRSVARYAKTERCEGHEGWTAEGTVRLCEVAEGG